MAADTAIKFKTDKPSVAELIITEKKSSDKKSKKNILNLIFIEN